MKYVVQVALLFAFVPGWVGCVDTGQERVGISLSVSGVQQDAPVVGRNGWQTELDQAWLVFGPLYLCAGVQAGELCETAQAEWTSATIVNTLDPIPVPAGEMNAISGFVRSWMYDLGFVSLLTQSEPLVTDAAQVLGNNSLRLVGKAVLDQTTIPFVAELVFQQEEATEQGIPVVRSGSDAVTFEHAIHMGDHLLVQVDPASWLLDVDFDAIAEAKNCTGSTCPVVRFEPGSQAARAIETQVVAGKPPEFIWQSSK